MLRSHLKYGQIEISFEYDESIFRSLGGHNRSPPLSDYEVSSKLDHPIHSKRLEEIVSPGETILFVVPDATRRTACGQVINLLVRRLIANGTAPFDINVIFATGIHRPVTAEEKQEIVTPFIAQRIKTLDHNPRDLMQLVRKGETSGGIPIELNRALTEHDHVVLLGGITFHYFAGFTGGRKLICPGLASARTIAATHKLAFDCERKDRRERVGTALLDGNAVHEAFVEAASVIRPAFAVSTIVNDNGDATDLYCGDWIESHRVACDAYASENSVTVNGKRDLVIVSCGGFPHDINMIQAHKALEAASQACTDGGTIVLIAECSEGMGRKDFTGWFSSPNSRQLAERLCENYQVNGQTAWSLMQKAERFDVRMVTSMPDESVRQIRCRKIEATDLISEIERAPSGYILPFGAKLQIQVGD